MTITFELSAEVVAQLRESAARRDRESMRRLLAESLAPAIEDMLQGQAVVISDGEFELAADELASLHPTGLVPLSDEALSRAGIYAGHP